MARKKSKIVGLNPKQVSAEKGLTPEQSVKFRNFASKPDSEGNWRSLSKARELALKEKSIMNNHEYELIGESIWDTYSDMAYIIAEGPKIEALKRGLGAGALTLGALVPGAGGQDIQQSQAPTSQVGGSDRPQHRVLRPTTGVSRNRMMAKRAARTTREHMRALRAQAAEGMARIQGRAQAERGVPVPPGPEPVSQASQQPHKLKQRPPFTQATGNKLTSPQGERGAEGFVNTPRVSVRRYIPVLRRALKARDLAPDQSLLPKQIPLPPGSPPGALKLLKTKIKILQMRKGEGRARRDETASIWNTYSDMAYIIAEKGGFKGALTAAVLTGLAACGPGGCEKAPREAPKPTATHPLGVTRPSARAAAQAAEIGAGSHRYQGILKAAEAKRQAQRDALEGKKPKK